MNSKLIWRWGGKIPYVIRILPVLKDNYTYLITDELSGATLIVDPVDSLQVVDTLKLSNLQNSSKAIAATHHHWDHTNGIPALTKHYKGISVYGFADQRIPGLTHPLADGDVFMIGNLVVKALHVPGHTTSSMAYVVGDDEKTAVFTGDTLFLGGCGKFFEGSAQEMYPSLYEKIDRLPSSIHIFPGHEYTIDNLMFAQAVEPGNEKIQKRLMKIQECTKEPISIPGTLEEERQTNPFIRCHRSTELSKFFREDNPIQLLQKIRDYKDGWKKDKVAQPGGGGGAKDSYGRDDL